MRTTTLNKKYRCALVLRDLKLKLHLGVTAKERAKKQTVLVTTKISFPRIPLACKTGKIEDAVCYDQLIQKIKKFCQPKEFTLIELLGMQLFLFIKKNLSKGGKLYLQVAKQSPLPELSQSVFEIGE